MRITIVQITSQHKNIFPRDIHNHLNFLKRDLKNIMERGVRNLNISSFSNYSFEHYVLFIGLDHILKNKFKVRSSLHMFFAQNLTFSSFVWEWKHSAPIKSCFLTSLKGAKGVLELSKYLWSGVFVKIVNAC